MQNTQQQEELLIEIEKLNAYIENLEDSLSDSRKEIKRLVDILKDVQDLVN